MKRNSTQISMFRHLLLIAVVLLNFSSLSAQGQSEITGTITDLKTNEPLVSVSIQVKGKAISSSSNLQGQYTIRASNNDELVFSYVGYKSQTVVVNQAVMN